MKTENGDGGSRQVSEKVMGKMKSNEETNTTISRQAGFEGAGKYLLSGGIAGAISRTATAPFDRLKIYLITAQPTTNPDGSISRTTARSTVTNLMGSLKSIYNEHSSCQSTATATSKIHHQNHSWGLRNFFIGNGLNVIKVFPESAIKFFVYEYAKNFLYHHPFIKDDNPHRSSSSNEDHDNRSNLVRFLAGGLAGVVSQVLIYPIETLKTQLMSSTINESFQGRALLIYTIQKLNKTGGIRGYYKGLLAATMGVFPYSAIDMSAFEALKRAYQRASGSDEETGVLATLLCGAISGGVGATIVYPLNVVRTRLQAQGTPYHPQRYTGIRDCIRRTYSRERWFGFYRGLAPSLLKVIPAVSISWLVYEQSNRTLEQLLG
ncbi:hypothetical protein MJO28_008571 [Puccinia striiformis f. sp. tritici]|uniref:MC family mitochondrial carrier protein n=3 Tax=Puccinia striiformis TaxID=27350 RepID=A0A0L0VLH4_9BASI|nr:hypothetical protein Pst134EB_016464 [Puccinia striiformis f. sp. tritici]KAI7949750.1 hypothetical protein MJO28_008571 [Puccinia striiformis f. sp. tritici]KAI7952836.1 hypothetical protein MJO29_008467 [Puccinia striiformis f. sp. tritici]KNE99859.1 hypothetical protein PSTG_06948 [Puccinia striiformis f. sp. tritici PST-78]POV94913.1 hypothetical protein PSTT_16577 [Puccinia striiformis]